MFKRTKNLSKNDRYITLNIIRKYYRVTSVSIIALLLSGCSQGHSPFITLLGAYFPYWMLCTVIGLLGALVIRVLLIYWGIDDNLPLPLIFILRYCYQFL